MSIVRSFSAHEDGNRLLLVYGWGPRAAGGVGKAREELSGVHRGTWQGLSYCDCAVE